MNRKRKQYRLILIGIVCIMGHIKLKAQLSPLFQIPYQDQKLSIFNPCFAGKDIKQNKFFSSIATYRPNGQGNTNNISITKVWNTVYGYDRRLGDLKNFHFDLGSSFIYNEYRYKFDEEDTQIDTEISNQKYYHGTWEFTFGGTIPMSYGKHEKRYTQSKKSSTHKERSSSKKNTKKVEKYYKNKNLEEINDPSTLAKEKINEYCPEEKQKNETHESLIKGEVSEYLSMNLIVDFNFVGLTNIDDLVFNDQITDLDIGSSFPFEIASNTDDPTLNSDGINLRSNNLDLGFGLLYQKKITSMTSVELGYAVRNISKLYEQTPVSFQQALPMKVFNTSVNFNINKAINKLCKFSFLYLEQSESYLPEVTNSVYNQYRFEGFYATEVSRHKIPSKVGLSTQFSKDNAFTLKVVSLYAGVHFEQKRSGYRKIQNDMSIKPNKHPKRGKTQYQKDSYYWLVFFNYDYHTPNSPLRKADTGGNWRIGATCNF